jgi:hypothetical protein
MTTIFLTQQSRRITKAYLDDSAASGSLAVLPQTNRRREYRNALLVPTEYIFDANAKSFRDSKRALQ